MLFEQAFMALPEFLTGLPYKDYRFEGTLLTAFSMAVLQELNGRNINNPISALRSEVGYEVDPTKRADLHVDLSTLNVFTPELAAYDFYPDNWLEAKFMRLNDSGRPTVDSLKSTLLLLKDLLRLTLLPPEHALPSSHAGRYLLHAYQGLPKRHIAKKRNSQGGVQGFTRTWAQSIRTGGRQELTSFRLDREVAQFDQLIGPSFRGMLLDIKVTTFLHEPRSTGSDVYWCYLTRIDDFGIEWNGRRVDRKAGMLTEGALGQLEELASSAAADLAS